MSVDTPPNVRGMAVPELPEAELANTVGTSAVTRSMLKVPFSVLSTETGDPPMIAVSRTRAATGIQKSRLESRNNCRLSSTPEMFAARTVIVPAA